MINPTVAIVFGAWMPIVLILFRWLGLRKSALIAVFGSFLLLPRSAIPMPFWGVLELNKRSLTGLAMLVGILVFDHRTLFRARPRLVDLPMIGFVLFPLLSFAANNFNGYPYAINQVWGHWAEWCLPYLVGRLYFGDRQGPRSLSMAVIITGLLSIPIYLFEMVAGPEYYLARLAYGFQPQEGMILRLGGWRPEGFQTSGLEVSTWIALASLTSVWFWIKGGWTFRRVPGWGPPLALVLTTMACRGVYGYLNLVLGLVVIGLTQLLKTRLVMAALAVVPLLYMVARTTDLWDGQALVEIARLSGRPDTVAYRLMAETAYLKKVVDHNLVLGFGGTDSSINGSVILGHLYADGWWLYEIRAGGLLGLSAFVLGLFLVPALLGLSLSPGRSSRQATPGALAWGLALFLLLHFFDSLHNLAVLSPTAIIGGSLVSLFLGKSSIRTDLPDDAPKVVAAEGLPSNRGPVAITIVVLILVEILGRIPRTTTTTTNPPAPKASPSPPEKVP